MKALVVTAPNVFGWQDLPMPIPGPEQALVRIEACGFCNATDRELIAGVQPYRPPFPFILGHEAVGTVVEVGSACTEFKVGDRVTRPNCGALAGFASGWSGFAEYGLVMSGQADYNAQRQLALPPGLEPEWAFMAISLAETRAFLDQVIEASRPISGAPVVVVGTGINGLTLTHWAKRLGAAPVVTLGRRAERLELARAGGADAVVNLRDPDCAAAVRDLTGGGAALLLEAIGQPAVLAGFGPLLAPDGLVGIYGAADGAAYRAAAEALAPAVVLQPGPEEQRYTRAMAEEILAGTVPAALWRTHVWEPAAFPEAVAAVARGEVVKGCVRL
jgi:threonine dehydrogenase-like Zn-dependent dehydrogenase